MARPESSSWSSSAKPRLSRAWIDMRLPKDPSPPSSPPSDLPAQLAPDLPRDPPAPAFDLEAARRPARPHGLVAVRARPLAGVGRAAGGAAAAPAQGGYRDEPPGSGDGGGAGGPGGAPRPSAPAPGRPAFPLRRGRRPGKPPEPRP